jgi:uncharacterized protein (TIGR02118 family)
LHKLILLFHKPDEVDRFEDRWSHEFVPAVEAMPGLRRVSVSRVHGGLTAEADAYLLHELYFDNRRALERAMASEQGQHAGRLLVSIAGEAVDVLFAEHLEDIPRAQASRT